MLRDVIAHVANSEPEYFRASGIGKPEGVKEALQAIEGAQPGALGPRLADLWQLLDTQLERITPEIRTAQVQRGEKLWTARRGFRRALEHPWEHLREMQRRLDSRCRTPSRRVRREHPPEAHLRPAIRRRRLPRALHPLLAPRRPEVAVDEYTTKTAPSRALLREFKHEGLIWEDYVPRYLEEMARPRR